MCANYEAPKPDRLPAVFGSKPVTFEYRREIYPAYDAPVLLRDPQGEWEPVRACFGLVPHWARDPRIARKTYNARSETIAALPSYRTPWRRRQFCLVPVMGFYEPRYEQGKAQRWAIRRQDGEPFALAAIWDQWKAAEGTWLRSFSLITVNASDHPLMNQFHAPEDEKRSVVVIPPGQFETWMEAENEADIRSLLVGPVVGQFLARGEPRAPKRTGGRYLALRGD